jgi:DMSO reductase anchor subunit
VRHPRIVQRSQGAMGGSFNTREFFHGRSPAFVRGLQVFYLAFAFALPLALLVLGSFGGCAPALLLAFPVQYAGLFAERWVFFAQANHPQNLYYQTIG